MKKNIFRQLKLRYGSHKAVATKLGISYQQYWRIRTGEIKPKKYLEIALESLLDKAA